MYKRLLKQNVEFREATRDDWKTIFEEYREGAFEEIGMPASKDPAQIRQFLSQLFSTTHGVSIVAVENETKGLLYVRNKGEAVEPHVVWFSNASVKDKMAAFVRFMKKTDTNKVRYHIIVREKDAPFYRHFNKLLEETGYLDNLYPDRERAILFQSKRPIKWVT